MAEGWDLVAEYRCNVADMLDTITDQDAMSRSLCGEWTVHRTAAHLLTFIELSMPRFMARMAGGAFNYDKVATRIAADIEAENTLGDIAAKLRAGADQRSPIKAFPPEMTLSDVVIHCQDIRRPLGLGTDVEDDVVDTVLDFLTTHKQAKAIVAKGRLERIEFISHDTGWSFGAGSRVEGAGEAVMMAIAGRPVLDELTGAGVELLASRP